MPNCTQCEHRIYTMDLQNPKCQDCQRGKIETWYVQQRNAVAAYKQTAIRNDNIRKHLFVIECRLFWIKHHLLDIEACWNHMMRRLYDNEKALEYVKKWDKVPKVDNLISDATERSGGTRTPGKDPTKEHNGPVLF